MCCRVDGLAAEWPRVTPVYSDTKKAPPKHLFGQGEASLAIIFSLVLL